MSAEASAVGAPVTCADLAHRYVAMNAACDAIDAETVRFVGSHKINGSLDDALAVCNQAQLVLRSAVLATPAVTLEDATAQLVHAIAELTHAHACADPGAFLREIIGALVSALRTISKATNIDPAEFGASEELFEVAEKIRSEG